jgi:sugar phosphate permease
MEKMNVDGKSPRVRRRQWLSVGLLTAVGTIFIVDRSTLAIANHDVSSDLHLSPTQMGLLLSSFSLAYAFSQLPLGVLLDRIGARVVLGCGILIWATTQIFTGFVGALSQFVSARILLGLGEAPIFPAGARMIADWFNKRERGVPTGFFLASTTIGPVLAPPIITALMLSLGWRNLYMALGAFGLLLTLIWFFGARNHKDVAFTAEELAYFDQTEAANSKFSFAHLGALLSQRSVLGLILGFVGVIYMIWLYLTWLPVYLEHERHFSIAHVGWILAIPYVFGTLGSLSCGYLADRLFRRGVSAVNSRKYPICIGLLGSAGFTVPVAFTPDANMAVIYLCGVMFFLYLASTGAWALVNVVTPRHSVATVGAMQNFGGYFGGSFAPVITGWLLEHTQSFKSALLMSALVAFTAALLYFALVRKPIETP